MTVPLSDLSLLGLVRHLAGVEQYWFRQVTAGEEVGRLYVGDDGEGLAFVVEPDPGLVEEAWATWRSEVSYAEGLVHATPDLVSRVMSSLSISASDFVPRKDAGGSFTRQREATTRTLRGAKRAVEI